MDTRFAFPIRVSDPVRWRRAGLACRGSKEIWCAPELIRAPKERTDG
jgi:hypothetical protein